MDPELENSPGTKRPATPRGARRGVDNCRVSRESSLSLPSATIAKARALEDLKLPGHSFLRLAVESKTKELWIASAAALEASR